MSQDSQGPSQGAGDRDLAARISEILSEPGVEVDVVAIPQTQDRMVRFRTLQEVLEQFDDETGVTGYLVQVRPNKALASASRAAVAGSSHEPQFSHSPAIYGQSGKLNVPYLMSNAGILANAGDYALARNIYKAVLQSGEQSSAALFGMASCYEAEGKVDLAISNFEESIAYHPTLESYRRLANLLIRQKKDHEAAEVLERALNLKDLEPSTRRDLHAASASAWGRAKAIDRAKSHYESALAIDPSSDSIRASLGTLLLQAGKTAEAKIQFEHAIQLNSRNDSAHFGMGSCWLAENDKRKAHDSFAAALENNRNNPSAIFHLVKCAYELKTYATAARLVEDYIEIAPINVNLLYSLAGLQFHLGRREDARATATKILELQPAHAGARELLRVIGNESGNESRNESGNRDHQQ